MPEFEVQIMRVIDDGFPGFVECVFVDAHNQEHTIVEKAPVVSRREISASSAFPLFGTGACEVILERADETGRVLLQVDTARPHGVESASGQTRFELLAQQVRPTMSAHCRSECPTCCCRRRAKTHAPEQ
jgi:hypothetical protein